MIRRPQMVLVLAVVLVLWGCATGRHYYYYENQTVRFYLYAPHADRVLFVSSLDNFTPHPAHSVEMGGWTFRTPAAGEFKYFYILDGETYVPPCRHREKDDFGSENCIYRPDL